MGVDAPTVGKQSKEGKGSHIVCSHVNEVAIDKRNGHLYKMT